MRLVGLDVGDKRIGVSLSDPEGLIAQNLTVIHRTALARDLQTLGNLVREHEVEKLVIGLPRRLDGTLGTQAEKVQAFGDKVSRALGVPVTYWDERLTTAQAERMLIEAGVKREARKGRIDAVAATLLLQNYLDFLRAQARRLEEQSEG
ncbi:MAG: Holliday junction resolvase RuvX [Chloroflexi bacterium]|nr:Holliday junction resolvase RuvX [Chloroflexota bacterium]